MQDSQLYQSPFFYLFLATSVQTGFSNVLIYLEDFKSSLGISNKYSGFKILNRDVIKPSINELNQRSDLTEPIKLG
ncbi:replication initiation protein [Shewanella sp. 202IG2-18]|uniref:replication initiation protein n=1 Tax=Parashewanella hymeniacidonis TaxID=2807618 RepID=UPI00195F9695|nr:replication initiation protein [Parashewanella hymeniacidonis]MBM7072774.1 replication initiation protein [Parashewanella hymeniacidonis]